MGDIADMDFYHENENYIPGPTGKKIWNWINHCREIWIMEYIFSHWAKKGGADSHLTQRNQRGASSAWDQES